MNRLFILPLLCLCLLMTACGSGESKKQPAKTSKPKTEKVAPRTDFHLYVQPYNNFSRKEAESIAEELKKNVSKYTSLTISQITVLPNVKLTTNEMNDAHTRYRAEKLLKRQKLGNTPGIVEVGLLDEDISTTLHEYDDYGIMGLSYVGLRDCVISTYRVKGKDNMWKVVLHEFMHGAAGMHHCSAEDPTCFMTDHSKSPNWFKRNRICPVCNKANKQNTSK